MAKLSRQLEREYLINVHELLNIELIQILTAVLIMCIDIDEFLVKTYQEILARF